MDSWCRKIKAKSGKVVSGSAARQVRISAYKNGMDDIIEETVEEPVKSALYRVNRKVSKKNIKLA